MLLLAEQARADLERWVQSGYPHETCGVLVGRAQDGLTSAARAVQARNRNAERARDRYELDPGDFVAADASARQAGLAIVGIWHSHPDCPPQPSETDRAAAWEGWSYLILSVGARGVEGMRSWRFAEGRFHEEGLSTMSKVVIRIPTPLRGYTNNQDEIEVECADVSGALSELGQRAPGILERVLDGNGRLRPFVNVFVGPSDVRTLQGLDTPLPEGAVLSIVPAVAGGMKAKDQRLSELRSTIPEVSPLEAASLQREGAALIDVREPDEVAQGSPPAALRIVRGFLELRIEDMVPDVERPILVMCAGGVRSLFAAEGLRLLGYGNVRSVAGGFTRWKADGLPVEVPRALLSSERERYSRHLLMPEVGEKGQLRLLESSVLLIGAGGLGSPAALYLAAAGVGKLGIVDFDAIERSNLQRQILHTDERTGRSKVQSALQTLRALNPDVELAGHELRLEAANVEQVFAGYDVVVDGSDNFATRYLVNDACVKLGLPNVHGSIYRFEGQVSVFWPAYPARRGPCYRCLYPEPPPPELAPSCAEAGVLGILPGVIGTLEAVEAVKLLLGIGDPLVGRLLHYDALRQRFTELALALDPACRYCAPGASFPGYVDYEAFCSSRAP